MPPRHAFLAVLAILLGIIACTADGGDTPVATPTVELTPMPTATPVPTPDPTPTSAPSPTPTPTSTATPVPVTLSPEVPCTVPDVSCEPRDVSGVPAGTSARAAASGYSPPEVPTLEETLEKPSRWADGHVDIVLRGTARPETFRCEWHGYALTNAEREAWLRGYLNLPATDPLPPRSEIESGMERRFAPLWEYWPPDAIAKQKAYIYGGLVEDIDLRIHCSADYHVHEYVLGDGPSVVTVVYYPALLYKAYPMYQQLQRFHRELSGAAYGEEYTAAEYRAELDRVAREAVSLLTPLFANRETILFLTPLADAQLYRTIAVEGWSALPAYDLQMAEDGTVNAVAYGVPDGDPEQTQTLSNLKSRVTTAAASDAAAGERIANITGLTQYYRDIGAYEDITPYDDEDNPFTPAQPPPSTFTLCRDGGAVPRPDNNSQLLRDCAALLRAKDALRGTGALNWSHETQITTWDGVTVDRNQNDSLYVRDLALANRGLNGFIPSALADMTGLRRLDLDDNALSGSLPPLLANLTSLQQVYASGNSLTGSLPPQWADLTNLRFLFLNGNDLSGSLPPEWGSMGSLEQLVLDGNGLSGAIPPEWGSMAALEDLFLRENALSGSIPPELEDLDSLEDLYLEGNAFTGCIPSGLRDTAEHDLATLGLPYCAPGG